MTTQDRLAVPRPFGRLLTAMVTPFAADGSLDVDGAAQLATLPGRRAAQRRPGDQRDHRRVADHHRRREGVAAPRGRRGRRRPGQDRRRRRHQRHRAHDRAGHRRREGRRARAAGRDAVLQQAAAGRPGPALHRGRRRHRPADHGLRHPAPHRRRRSPPRPCPARRARADRRGQGRQGRPGRHVLGARAHRPRLLLRRGRPHAAAAGHRRRSAWSAPRPTSPGRWPST